MTCCRLSITRLGLLTTYFCLNNGVRRSLDLHDYHGGESLYRVVDNTRNYLEPDPKRRGPLIRIQRDHLVMCGQSRLLRTNMITILTPWHLEANIPGSILYMTALDGRKRRKPQRRNNQSATTAGRTTRSFTILRYQSYSPDGLRLYAVMCNELRLRFRRQCLLRMAIDWKTVTRCRLLIVVCHSQPLTPTESYRLVLWARLAGWMEEQPHTISACQL